LKQNNIAWMPIDIPKFQFSDEVINDYISSRGTKVVPPSATAFDADHLIKDQIEINDLSANYKLLLSHIRKHLPYKELHIVRIHNMHKLGNLHMDYGWTEKRSNMDDYKNCVLNEPCGYRILLRGDNSGSLMVESNEGMVNVTQPKESDCYVLGHTDVLHSNVFFDSNRYVVFIHGTVDKEQHENLIQRSVTKYNNSIILRGDIQHTKGKHVYTRSEYERLHNSK
jgi:hypothetical protein